MKYFFIFFSLVVLGCRTDKKYHDTIQEDSISLQTDALSEVMQFQRKLNRTYKNPETSPLPDRYRKNFEHLDFFAPDTSFRVIATLERTPDALPFMMPTTTAEKSEEVVYGIVSFTLKGKEYTLEVYQSPTLIQEAEYKNYLFLPFLDATNGNETYGGGRYLDLAIPEKDTVVIDFNKAYNPYCAYNKKYSCPLVPSVNTLDIKVLAGVKAFKK